MVKVYYFLGRELDTGHLFTPAACFEFSYPLKIFLESADVLSGGGHLGRELRHSEGDRVGGGCRGADCGGREVAAIQADVVYEARGEAEPLGHVSFEHVHLGCLQQSKSRRNCVKLGLMFTFV